MVQRELEAQRQLVDYGTGSLGSFPPVMSSHCKFESNLIYRYLVLRDTIGAHLLLNFKMSFCVSVMYPIYRLLHYLNKIRKLQCTRKLCGIIELIKIIRNVPRNTHHSEIEAWVLCDQWRSLDFS